jgi:FkbM family methyltransferase
MKTITTIWSGNIKLKIEVNTTTDERRVKEAWAISDYFKEGFNIQNEDTIIDIGAHIGTFTIYAAKLADKGRVYSFEPHPENFALLKRNCKLNNLKNIELFQQGVYKEKESVKLFTNKEKTGEYSIYKESPNFISIECITLKDIFDNNGIQFCDFLKIDCEGAEYDILFNTPTEYFNKIDKIVLEYHDYINRNKKWYHLVIFLAKRGLRLKLSLLPRNKKLFMLKILEIEIY